MADTKSEEVEVFKSKNLAFTLINYNIIAKSKSGNYIDFFVFSISTFPFVRLISFLLSLRIVK